MIYSGSEESGPVTTGEATQIGTSAFNENFNDNAYVGYMYGTLGSSTYEETHANINDCTIKGKLDSWYEQNLVSYETFIDTSSGFCGDRMPSTSNEYLNVSGGYNTIKTYYASVIRLYSSSSRLNANPSFQCVNKNDLYTLTGIRGNNILNNPIGLITADEIAYAGGSYGWYNKGYYLYTNKDYWNMTPVSYLIDIQARIFYVYRDGNLFNHSSDSPDGVRPVINLRTDVTLTGNGTSNDPYIIS